MIANIIYNKVNLKLHPLDERIKKLEKKLYEGNTNTESHQQKLLLLEAQYNKLSHSKAENILISLKQIFYEQGEKSGKLLA